MEISDFADTEGEVRVPRTPLVPIFRPLSSSKALLESRNFRMPKYCSVERKVVSVISYCSRNTDDTKFLQRCPHLCPPPSGSLSEPRLLAPIFTLSSIVSPHKCGRITSPRRTRFMMTTTTTALYYSQLTRDDSKYSLQKIKGRA